MLTPLRSENLGNCQGGGGWNACDHGSCPTGWKPDESKSNGIIIKCWQNVYIRIYMYNVCVCTELKQVRYLLPTKTMIAASSGYGRNFYVEYSKQLNASTCMSQLRENMRHAFSLRPMTGCKVRSTTQQIHNIHVLDVHSKNKNSTTHKINAYILYFVLLPKSS